MISSNEPYTGLSLDSFLIPFINIDTQFGKAIKNKPHFPLSNVEQNWYDMFFCYTSTKHVSKSEVNPKFRGCSTFRHLRVSLCSVENVLLQMHKSHDLCFKHTMLLVHFKFCSEVFLLGLWMFMTRTRQALFEEMLWFSVLFFSVVQSTDETDL